MSRFSCYAVSAFLHILCLTSLSILSFRNFAPDVPPLSPRHSKEPLRIEIEEPAPSRSAARSGPFSSASLQRPPLPQLKDLAPAFAKTVPWGQPVSADADAPVKASFGIRNGTSREWLFTEGKVLQIFDLLAIRINRYLEFPVILAENGVEGIATLELYFDNSGNVDESKSKCSGDNRAVRGLLIKATRAGLAEWLIHDARRLNRDQFKNQHFRADFVISAMNRDSSEFTKTLPGSYSFLRRRFSDATCLGATAGGEPFLNLTCVALKIAGSVKRQVDGKYLSRFRALMDHLEHYDHLELNGINEIAQSKDVT